MKREERAESCRKMLAEGYTYEHIIDKLRMSSATISAIARGERGYKDSGPGRPRCPPPEYARPTGASVDSNRFGIGSATSFLQTSMYDIRSD